MSELPRRAQLFVVLICLASLVAIAAALRVGPGIGETRWELGLFLALAVAAGGKKIPLIRRRPDDEICSMTLGFAIAFVAMVRFGPGPGVLVAAAGCLSSCLYPQRQAAHQILFNVALAALQSAIGGLAFFHLNGSTLSLSPIRSFPAVVVSCLIFFLVNTGGVASIIGLCTGQNVRRLWAETFLWTAPSYFAGAGIGTLMLILCRNQIGNVLLFGSPVAYLTYQSYAVTAARAVEKQCHIEALQDSQTHLRDLYLATIKSLALAIDAKDQYTHQHILRVQRYAIAVANKLGISGAALEGIKTGALLHDIGKLGIPEYLLLKAGPLTEDEYAQVKKHPEIGAAILDPVDFPWPVLPIVKSHHERWDGNGYPEGLQGEAIPLGARILSVCDVYDALTSDRSYRHAWNHESALNEIRRGRGTQFDPDAVDAFLSVVEEIVSEMATEGESSFSRPTQCSIAAPQRMPTSKADQAVRDIQRAACEPWALFEIIEILSAQHELQETLQCLVEKLETLYPGASCLFLTKDLAGSIPQADESDGLVIRAAAGVNAVFFSGGHATRPNGRTFQVARDRTAYLGEYDGGDLSPGAPADDWVHLRSALIVPVLHKGVSLGTINLYHPQFDAFCSSDQYLLETIAARAAMTLYHGLLFDQTRSHAFTDPLTGLHNMRYLTQVVHHLQSPDPAQAQEATRFALMYLDLDNFKSINDMFGHQKGDQVLRDMANTFRLAVRDSDVVVRYGGDEFIIILQEAGAHEAEMMAARLQEAVAGYDPGLPAAALGDLRMGISIGFSCFPKDGADCDTLLSVADAQMYCNKTERKLGARLDSTGYAVLRNTLLKGAIEKHALVPTRLANNQDHGLKGKKKCLLTTVRPARRFGFSKGTHGAKSLAVPFENSLSLEQEKIHV